MPFGGWLHPRGRGHCRGKSGRAQQRSTVSGEYAPDSAWAGAARSSTSQGSTEPLCAREPTARTERFLRENVISDDGLFSSYEGQQGATNGQY